MEQQRAAYAVQGVDESEPAQAGKKRKKQIYTNGEDVRTDAYLTHFREKRLLDGELISEFMDRKLVVGRILRGQSPPQNLGNARIPPFT